MIWYNVDLIYTARNGGVGIAESGNSSGVVSPLNIDTTSLPSGQVAVAYSQALSISGGTIPYSCSLLAGAHPTGISLTGAGSCTISGTPTQAGTFNMTYRAMDGLGATDDQSLSLVIAAAATLDISTVSLP